MSTVARTTLVETGLVVGGRPTAQAVPTETGMHCSATVALDRAVSCLLADQNPEGHWCAELEEKM